MNPFTRFFSWLFGPALPVFTGIKKRMTINGIELEKILVFAKGREATLHEMLAVTCDARFNIQGAGEGSGFACSTEEWNQGPNETESAAIRRIAHEVSAKFPGLAVIAFAWPDSYPTIIAVIVTLDAYAPPFPLPNEERVTSIAAARG